MLRPPLVTPDALPGQRLLLDGFVLDLPARELRRANARRGKRLTVKSQQVLLTLALRPGEVISREALMDAVWPDSYPTGDVLTQAIVQLRRALDDDADAPRYIETVARSGYRLLGEVRWETRDSPSANRVAAPAELGLDGGHEAPTTSAEAIRARPRWPYVMALAAVLALAALAWRHRESPPPGQQDTIAPAARAGPTPVVLASTPAFEFSPAPSPDGTLLAFSASDVEYGPTRIYLQSSREFHARPLTEVDGVWDDFPAWSPDQQWIAFRRRSAMESDGSCEIRLVSVVSGVERLAAPCTGRPTGLAFSADGKTLIAGGDNEARSAFRGLWRIDLDSGRVEPLPMDAPADNWDALPRVSGDGRWILFRRGVATVDLFRVSIDGGRPEPLTTLSADLRGHDWLGRDGAVVFSLVNVRGHQLYRIDHSGNPPQPLQVTGGQPRSAADGSRIFFEQVGTRYLLRRLDPDSSTLVAPGKMASSRSDLLPAVAPDGNAVAFYSDRSGEIGLWLASTNADAAAMRVTGLQPHPRFTPVWSPNGAHLLVAASGPEGDGLYEVEAASRRNRPLKVPIDLGAFGYLDQHRVLINEHVGGEYRLGVYDREHGGRLDGLGIAGVGFFQVDAAGQRILYTSEHSPALHAANFQLEPLGVIRDDFVHPLLYRGWRVAGQQLWFLQWDVATEKFGVWRLPLSGLGGAAESVLPPLMTEGDLVPNPSVLADQDLTALWIGEQTRRESDIAMVELDELRVGE